MICFDCPEGQCLEKPGCRVARDWIKNGYSQGTQAPPQGQQGHRVVVPVPPRDLGMFISRE